MGLVTMAAGGMLRAAANGSPGPSAAEIRKAESAARGRRRAAAAERKAAGELIAAEAALGQCPLDDARDFAASVLWATSEQLDALTLACAASHALRCFSTVPRLLFTSEDPESGKTTALDIVRMLGWNTWMTDATSYGLRSKFNEPEPPFVLVDEISDIFGMSGLRGQGSPVGKIMKEGYRQQATLSMSVDRSTVDVPSFCFAAFGGLKNAVPRDLRRRCIVFGMKPVPLSVTALRASEDPDTEAEGMIYRELLHHWAGSSRDEIRQLYRNLAVPHRMFRARRAQIWGPLFAVAQLAGGNWPGRALAAFRALALDASEQPVLTPPQMVLRDCAAIFRDRQVISMFGRDLKDALRELPDSALYNELRDRRLGELMIQGIGREAGAIRIGKDVGKGYYARDVLKAWAALEAVLSQAEAPGDEPDSFDLFDVTEGQDQVTETAGQEGVTQ